MKIINTTFVKSAPSIKEAPENQYIEFAFIGRSNVGKSSLINFLVNKKQLALTSNKPGKTIYLNYFLINKDIYWVDLPGYGYASKSKNMRKLWNKNMYEYLEKRDSLACIFLLIDASISPQKIDIEMLEWLYEHQRYFAIIFTKIDKNTHHEITQNIHQFFSKLPLPKNTEIPYFMTSVSKKQGRDEILEAIEEMYV
ncbi:MAG: ribosome biogenesis GTP-binding protein YihA/YsxC [Chitinophagaceae bacterium]